MVTDISFMKICNNLLSMEPWSMAKKTFELVWRCHHLLSGFLAKGHLPWVSCQSRRSLMIRAIMKLSRGQCTDLLALTYCWGNPQLGDRLMKGLCDQSSLKMGSLTNMWDKSCYDLIPNPRVYCSCTPIRINLPLFSTVVPSNICIESNYLYFPPSSQLWEIKVNWF